LVGSAHVFFAHGAHAEPYFSDLEIDPGDNKVIFISVPILTTRDEFKGVVLGEFRMDATSISPFYGTLVKMRVGRSGDAFILDKNHQIIFSSNFDEIGRTFP
jgi:hypothetical protein